MTSKPWLAYFDQGVPHSLEYPDMDVYSWLRSSTGSFGDRLAIGFMGRDITFSKLFRLVERFAACLYDKGIRGGDRIVLLMPNCPQFIIAYYALMRLGAVAVMANPLNVERELAFKFRDSGARGVIALDLLSQKLNAVRRESRLDLVVYTGMQDFLPFPLNLLYPVKRRLDKKMPVVRIEWDAQTHSFTSMLNEAALGVAEADIDPGSMAVLIYSGGTTGVSKGIMLSHRAVIANAMQIRSWVNMGAQSDSILSVLPLFHGFGMQVCMNAPLSAGACTILLPRFNAAELVKTVEKTHPTLFAGVPTMFIAVKELPGIARRDLKSFRGIFCGAAPLPEAVMREFEQMTGASLIEGYGLTEAVTAIACNPLNGQRKPGTIGIPFPDVEWRVVDLVDGQKEVATGETGELILRSPTLMSGYLNQAEKTAETIRDGWLYTGDIASLDEDGYATIVDRKKDLVIVSGFNVFPSEIDEVLHEHPKVEEGVAIGLPHQTKGEFIKAYVVPKRDQTLSEEEIIAFCRKNLSAYMVPREVEIRDSLPKSMIGKVLRRELKEEELRKRKSL